MQLLRVYSTQSSFKEVKFNPTGLSFIVAEQKSQGSSQKGQTYNGVGKSLLVRIIHFCFGAGIRDYKNFCEKLPEWDFSVDFIIKDKAYTAKRSTDNYGRISLNDEEMSVTKFNKIMQNLCFEIPTDIKFLSFRSLLPFFIRPTKESYALYDRPGKANSMYQSFLYNAFLLGLDVGLVQNKYNNRKEKERIKKLENNFENDSLLRDFFTGNKDVDLTIVDLDEKVNRLESNLKEFKVAEDYYEIQKKADYNEKILFELSNEVIMLQNNLQNIDENLMNSPDMNKEDIKAIYEESKILFSDKLMKTLNELEDFHEKLIYNREKRLLEQRNKKSVQMQEKISNIEKLQDKLNKDMKYLGDHQALDLFVSVNNQKANLESERDNLKKYQTLQQEYKKKERQFELNLIESTQIAEEYLNEIQSEVVELRNYFRKLAKGFYPDSVTGLTIENNDGDNQLRFNINAKIESDTSDGINNVKIFCYDLTLLFLGNNHNINFVFHDSRLFDGIDERQKAEMFKIVHNEFYGQNKQYIATVNQNQLEELKRHLTTDELQEIITDNVILRLTDESDVEKLLGIKVDM